MRVDELLARARALGVARIDAQALSACQLGRPRSWLLAHGDEPLADADARALLTLLERRAAGEPLAYLVGEKEFHGLMLAVNRNVLVPRPETELLVDWALECLAAARAPRPRVVDLGTGSGAIAIAIAGCLATAQVTATDASLAALAVAAANAARHHATVDFHAGNWWAAVGQERFDLALSNPPYIAAGDPHLAALVHEPQQALVSGEHGLDALREIIAGAPPRLQPGGWLLLEHGHDQADAVRALLQQAGFVEIETRRDLAGLERSSGGRRPA